MKCELIILLKAFMKNQVEINDAVGEELSNQDDVNEAIVDILSAMTKHMNDIESRLNKLEKEKRRNATNK